MASTDVLQFLVVSFHLQPGKGWFGRARGLWVPAQRLGQPGGARREGA